MGKKQKIEDLRAELADVRANVRQSTAAFRESIEPKNVLLQGVEEVSSFASTEFNEAKAQVVDEYGFLRTDRVFPILGAVAGIVVFAITVNVLAGKKKVKAPKQPKAITPK